VQQTFHCCFILKSNFLFIFTLILKFLIMFYYITNFVHKHVPQQYVFNSALSLSSAGSLNVPLSRKTIPILASVHSHVQHVIIAFTFSYILCIWEAIMLIKSILRLFQLYMFSQSAMRWASRQPFFIVLHDWL
jgi:hypothetical protein